MIKRINKTLLFAAILSMCFCAEKTKVAKLNPIEELGKKLFFDTNLSEPPGQSCAACHDPKVGWTGPNAALNEGGAVYQGAVAARFGNRKPPSSGYAGECPVLDQDEKGDFIGGMFWDGRATGKTLGDPLAEQAMGPFLNPLEQNNPDEKAVVMKVKNSNYFSLFEEVFPEAKSMDWEKDAGKIYVFIARAIAAFERSAEVNLYSSKFDAFWGKAKSKGLKVEEIKEKNLKDYAALGMDDNELKGLMLFNTKARCANCHTFKSADDKPPLFTDFSYDNLGTPKNPKNPFYSMPAEWNPEGKSWIDKGLGGFLETAKPELARANYGKHKVPTLRNVDLKPQEGLIKAYFHNGFFKSLKDIVHFYNTRDLKEAGWPAPEVEENVNRTELGNLGLTDDDEQAIVAFLKTLSDGFMTRK
jgi:cytochrome c peroxidase